MYITIAGLLLRKLDISHVEILVAYDKFFKKYQNGEISKDDFLKENQENMMAETLFNVFDEDNSGTLNFYEFMMVKYTSNLQSPEEKLNWIFTAFDQDGGGSIDGDEIRGIVVGLFKMSDKIENEEEIIACIKEIQEAIDADGDGNISKEEFVENAMKSSFIYKMVTEKIGM